MAWQYNPSAILIFAGAAIILAFTWLAWQRRHTLTVKMFVVLSLLITWRMVGYGASLLSADIPTMMFWIKLSQLATVAPVAWLLFIMSYTGYERWITRRNVALTLIVPITNIVIALTNDFHHLYWLEIRARVVDSVVLYERSFGIGYLVGVTYLFAIVVFANILLILTAIRMPAPYKKQIIPLVIASAFMVIGNLLTISNVEPIWGLELAPLAYAVAIIPIGWSLLRYRLLDLAPAAYDRVIKSMSDAMFVLDEHNRVVDANPAAAQLFDGERQTLIGQGMEQLFTATRSTPACFWMEHDTHEEFTLKHGDVECWFDARVSLLHDPHGELSGRVIVLRDITALKHAEQTISKYAKELEERNGELNAFSHTVAHDLKAPINVVIGYTELIQEIDGDSLPASTRQHLNSIHSAAQKMTEMINSLLLLANVRDAGQVIKEVDAAPVVQSALKRFQHEVNKRGIQIEVVPDLPYALGHEQWIEEVFANLIGNAIKYIGKQNPTPRISVRGSYHDGMVRYEVQDNGIGIAPENQARLFEMFSRFHQREASGMGLGLSIVLRIITKLGGEVGIESEVGKGSTFWFTLPAAQPIPQTATVA